MNKKNLIPDKNKEPLKMGHYKKTSVDPAESLVISGDNSPHTKPYGKYRKK
ncbi:MAG: hypothetical protein WC806_03050 [Candidatus Gracilibacteria bacterium]|jgi:hypothetical protein